MILFAESFIVKLEKMKIKVIQKKETIKMTTYLSKTSVQVNNMAVYFSSIEFKQRLLEILSAPLLQG